jgi:hypothetical protein
MEGEQMAAKMKVSDDDKNKMLFYLSFQVYERIITCNSM